MNKEQSNLNPEAASPVIGVMLMLVVTIVVAAVVSGFASGYSNDDTRAPTAVRSCDVIDGGVLFTHESGDAFDLLSAAIILANGEETRRFYYPSAKKAGALPSLTTDLQMMTGNQFYFPADNDGSVSGVAGAYIGWDNPEFYLIIDEIATYMILERESNQIISRGMINI